MTLTVEPLCYHETVTLATKTENGATVNQYISLYSEQVKDYYPAETNSALLT
jgi:hypothetical protein